jgi:hypothetical protein
MTNLSESGLKPGTTRLYVYIPHRPSSRLIGVLQLYVINANQLVLITFGLHLVGAAALYHGPIGIDGMGHYFNPSMGDAIPYFHKLVSRFHYVSVYIAYIGQLKSAHTTQRKKVGVEHRRPHATDQLGGQTKVKVEDKGTFACPLVYSTDA